MKWPVASVCRTAYEMARTCLLRKSERQDCALLMLNLNDDTGYILLLHFSAAVGWLGTVLGSRVGCLGSAYRW